MTIGAQRLREVNELVHVRELEVAEGAAELSENIDLTDGTRERLRAGADRLRKRSPDFLEQLEELEADLRTAIAVGQTSEPEARIASWRGADRLTTRTAMLGEQVLLRWMHLDRIERVILQLLGEQDLKEMGVTEYPWPARRKKSPAPNPVQPTQPENEPRRWWPFGRKRKAAEAKEAKTEAEAESEADAAVKEAFRILGSDSEQPNDEDAAT